MSRPRLSHPLRCPSATICARVCPRRGAAAFSRERLAGPRTAANQKKKPDYGIGLSTEITAPEEMVLQAVDAVVNNGIIQGSREYNKDKFVDKALPRLPPRCSSRIQGTRQGFLQGADRSAGSGEFQGKQ